MEKAYLQLKTYLKEKTTLADTDIEKITSNFAFKKAKRHEFLQQEWQICRHFYFLTKGCLRLYEIDKKGNDVTAFFCIRRQLFHGFT